MKHSIPYIPFFIDWMKIYNKINITRSFMNTMNTVLETAAKRQPEL